VNVWLRGFERGGKESFEAMTVLSSQDNVRIAGRKSCKDWRSFRTKLTPGGEQDVWQRAAKDYFHARVTTRYLEPIQVIKKLKKYKGEGFSIVAIQCSMIEFLESTVRGVSYCYRRCGSTTPLAADEYSDSRGLFVDFLRKRHPFANNFTTRKIAKDFYAGVRCGLLHEARTKNGWLIHRSGPSIISVGTPKIVYWDNFQTALEAFIEGYETALETQVDLQKALIRKFDSLCT
jgi:hypothetical protein